MMIGPEGYYEVNLKGKTKQEILKKIRSLKREINQLKRSLEEHFLETEEMFPTRLTRLKCYRNYLDRAIRAYEEAGGRYIPTKAEQKSRDFDASLDSLQKMVFFIGGFFGGYETRTYTVSGDKVILDVEHSLTLKPSNLPVFYPFTKEEFISGLREIHIGEWKRKYDDPLVMDGTQWELEIHFDGNSKPVRIYGSNAYPYNFQDLTDFLGIEEEEIEDEEETEEDE